MSSDGAKDGSKTSKGGKGSKGGKEVVGAGRRGKVSRKTVKNRCAHAPFLYLFNLLTKCLPYHRKAYKR
jgi:hypothetical protein